MMENEIRLRHNTGRARELNLHDIGADANGFGQRAGIGVDDSIAPARYDVDGMRIEGGWGCRIRYEMDGLNNVIQPAHRRKVDQIRGMREIGDGVVETGARLRVGDGLEHEGIGAAAAGQRVAVAGDGVAARIANDVVVARATSVLG